jgi:hypothetical protein
MIAKGGIENSSNNFYNYSYIWAKNDNGNGVITNTGRIINFSIDGITTPMIHGRSLDNRGLITGKAFLYFYGTTSTSGGGITGVTGVTADTIKMYDVTRNNPPTIYDDQTGIVNPNVIYNSWGIPDSARVYAIGCSVEILMQVPLAINWNYFYADLLDNIPELSWSAEYDRGTVFEIQRSYDGTRFTAIINLPGEIGQSAYEYRDRSVNNHAPVVYYRIKATELSGVEKYTQTRIVKFSNKQGAIIHLSPNPFTNNFIISYQAAEKEMLTILMFNINGQQQLTKNVSVNSGTNNINITEAAQLPKGIYIIQVTNGYKMISSGKLIKQ